MPNAFIVLNPAAGKTVATADRTLMERYLAAEDWGYEFHEAVDRSQAEQAVRHAVDSGADYVVAVGGDGTVSALAGALTGTDVPLAIVPRGTGNVLARQFGIPLRLTPALALLTGEHTIRRIDGMQLGDRVCLLNISMGVTAALMRDTNPDEKRLFGRIAYVRAGLGKLMGLYLNRFTIEVDGEAHQLTATDVMIVNSRVLGDPALRLEPGICPDDGRINACAVRARTVFDVLKLLWHALVQSEKKTVMVRCFSAGRTVRVTCANPLPAQADGEYIGEMPIEVRVLPGAVGIVVPASGGHPSRA